METDSSHPQIQKYSLKLLNVMVISKKVDVVIVNVPFPVGLDLLDIYEMVVKNLFDILECHKIGCSITLTR